MEHLNNNLSINCKKAESYASFCRNLNTKVHSLCSDTLTSNNPTKKRY